MKFNVPAELEDPCIREHDRIPHGEQIAFVALTEELVRRKVTWLNGHPGWSFTATTLVRCADGTPSPAYDVVLEYQRPRTPAELEAQAVDRAEWLVKKEADYHRREEEQKVLLEEVLASIQHKAH